MDWRKSSYSAQNGACVEIRKDLSALRSSKNPGGPTLYTSGVQLLVKFAKTQQR